MNKIQVVNRLPATYDPAALLSVLRQMQVAVNFMVDGYTHTTTSVSANYTASLNDSVIVVDTTGGNISVVLPRADEAKNKRFTVKKADSSVNTISVSSANGNVDTASTSTLSASLASWDFVSDGTNYWIV